MRLTRRTCRTIAALSVAMPATMSAQTSLPANPDSGGERSVAPSMGALPYDSLRPGHRVRVMLPGGTIRRNGTIVGIAMDTLVFRGERDKEVLRLQRGRLHAMEVSAGQGRSRRRAFAGAAIGTVAGFGLARVFQWMDERDGTSCSSESGNCPMKQQHLFGGLTLGAGMGFGIGASTTGERWRIVSIR